MANIRSHGRALLLAALVTLPAVPLLAQPLPSSVTILTRDDFARLNYFSLADVLDHAVGMDVERSGFRGTLAHARLRGLPETQALVIAIDGRPLTHAFDGAVDLSQIPLDMVDRIEITRGGAPVADGPSAAGLVNLITSRPERTGADVELQTDVGRLGTRQHNGRFFDRFHHAGDLTYVGGIQQSGGFTSNDQSDLKTHFANFTRAFKKGGYWGVEYSNFDGFSGTPNGSAVPFDQWNGTLEQTAANPGSQFEQTFQTARLLAASPLVAGGTFYADLTESFRHSDLLPAPGQPKVADDDHNSEEGRLRWQRAGFMAGVEGNKFIRHNMSAERREVTQAGAFAQTHWRADRAEIVPGIRYDRNSRAGSGATARVATLYRPGDPVVLSASYQRGLRFPTFDELFPVNGSPANLAPEKNENVDVGIALEDTGYRVAMTGFDARIENTIAFNPAIGNFDNVGEDRARGVELEGSTSFGSGAWRETRLAANVTYRDTRRKEPGQSSFGRAPMAPRQMAWGEVDYRLPAKITFINEVRYEGASFENTGGTGRRLPPFALWNVKFTVNIFSALLYVSAENVLARHYAEGFGDPSLAPAAGLEPQPTRTFWAGITIRFLD